MILKCKILATSVLLAVVSHSSPESGFFQPAPDPRANQTQWETRCEAGRKELLELLPYAGEKATVRLAARSQKNKNQHLVTPGE